MVEKMTTLKLKCKCKITTPIHKKIRFLIQQNTTTANQYYKFTHLHKTSVNAIHLIYRLLKDMTRFYDTTQIFFFHANKAQQNIQTNKLNMNKQYMISISLTLTFLVLVSFSHFVPFYPRNLKN